MKKKKKGREIIIIIIIGWGGGDWEASLRVKENAEGRGLTVKTLKPSLSHSSTALLDAFFYYSHARARTHASTHVYR